MTTKCKTCQTAYTSEKAEKVFTQTGGLCWTCQDKKDVTAYQAKLSPARIKEIKNREAVSAQFAKLEGHKHCQLSGLPVPQGVK